MEYRLSSPSVIARGILYFHAQYRQQTPTPEIARLASNLTGAHNYVFVETRGSGHLMGITWGVQQIAPGWFGEGDDMTFIDDPSTPVIYGTGTEDYINGAWDFGSAFANLYHGAPLIESFQQSGGLYLMYRWHADNPIVFREYPKHTIEHGRKTTGPTITIRLPTGVRRFPTPIFRLCHQRARQLLISRPSTTTSPRAGML